MTVWALPSVPYVGVWWNCEVSDNWSDTDKSVE